MLYYLGRSLEELLPYGSVSYDADARWSMGGIWKWTDASRLIEVGYRNTR